MDTNMITHPADVVGVRKIDVRRGTVDGSVSSQWFSRPDDQRFLSLTDLQEFLQGRREACNADIFETGKIRVKADPNDPRRLDFVMPDGTVATPNHWSFSQICSRLGVPAGFIRDKLSYTAGPVMYECLQNANSDFVNVLRMDKDEGKVEFIYNRLEASKKTTNEIFDAVFNMEGHPARSLWDVVQGATAVARDIPHQDARVSMERAAGKLMALVEG